MASKTRYAAAGDLNIAYQTLGSGPIDLFFVPGVITHIEFLHEIPGYDEFLNGLASFSRVVTFDKSGQGLSDRAPGVPSLEQRMDDIRAIMDDIGTKRCVLLGCSEGAPISMMFAATHPTQVSHLIVFGAFARLTSAPGYSFMKSEEDMIRRADAMVKNWGTGELAIRGWMSSLLDQPDGVEQFAKLERLTCSPGALRSMYQQNMMIDVRSILPSINAPTLVLHRKNDALIPVANAIYLAENISGAKLIRYDDCTDHLIFSGNVPRIIDDIHEFVTGAERRTPANSRVLATVMFTDIVQSTTRAAELGDETWRALLREHDALCARIVAHHRGSIIKSTGDGVLATFDGPGRAIRAALEAQASLSKRGVQIRAGLHTGEVGLADGDIVGIAVHAAARVMGQAQSGEVLISRVVKDLVAGGGFCLSSKGAFNLKGFPEKWDLYSVSI